MNVAQVDGTIDGLPTGSHVHVHVHVHERGAGGSGELLHPHAVEPKVGRGGRGECHVEPGREGRIGRGLLVLVLRDVRASVLAVVDALSSPGGFGGQCRDDLLRLDEPQTSLVAQSPTYLCRGRDVEEVNEPNVLVPDDLDLIDQSESAQIIPEHLLRHALVKATKINVPRSITLLDALQHLTRDGAGLAPTDLELVPMELELLDVGVGMEGRGGRAVEEGDEDAGLFGKDSDGLERAEVNEVEEFVDRSVGGEVPDVDCSAGLVVRGCRGRCRCCYGRCLRSASESTLEGRCSSIRDDSEKQPVDSPDHLADPRTQRRRDS